MPIIFESPAPARCKTCHEDLKPLEIEECRECIAWAVRREQSALLVEWRDSLPSWQELQRVDVQSRRRKTPTLARELFHRLHPYYLFRDVPRAGLCVQVVLKIRDCLPQMDGRVRCGICRQVLAGPVEIDHIIPISVGGPHHVHNLQYAHPECNREKGGWA